MIAGERTVTEKVLQVAKKVKKTVKNKVAKKKVAAKKPRAKTVRTEKPLSVEEIANFKELLLAKRQELIGDVNSIQDEALKKSRLEASGDLSSMPIHMADIGTDNYEQEFSLNLLDSERKLLNRINSALNRMENSTYGVCQGTGKQIQRSRLEAKPWARYSIEYARMIEKGLVLQDDDNES